MMNNQKRKAIARAFMNEFFGGCGELWRNYNALDETHKPKSWCPIPCPWVHTNREDPIIGVGETFEEVKSIVEAELPESRWGMVEYEEYTYTDSKKYWVVYD